MASSFAKRLLVSIVSGMLIFATGADAHPHVWVSVKTTVLFKGDAIVGLQQHWTFDEFYAAMAIEGLDKNNDGVYDRQELAPLAQTRSHSEATFPRAARPSSPKTKMKTTRSALATLSNSNLVAPVLAGISVNAWGLTVPRLSAVRLPSREAHQE